MNNSQSALSMPSCEMVDRFVYRTNLHIAYVRKNLLLMEGYGDISSDLLRKRAAQHDLSKFSEPERISYIWINWSYFCKANDIAFEYPEDVKVVIYQGHQHHICNNRHHPEAHPSPDTMTLLDIVEMVCDWTAISQEVTPKNSSCKTWADENIDKKWNFSSQKKQLIFEVIQELDCRLKKERE